MRTLFLAALLTAACSPREQGVASLPPGDYQPRKGDDELPHRTVDGGRVGAAQVVDQLGRAPLGILPAGDGQGKRNE